MFTLLQATSPWALERAAGHLCATGRVYLSGTQSIRPFVQPEADIR